MLHVRLGLGELFNVGVLEINGSCEDTPILNPFPASLSNEFVKKNFTFSSHHPVARALNAWVQHLHDAGVVKLTGLHKGVNRFIKHSTTLSNEEMQPLEHRCNWNRQYSLEMQQVEDWLRNNYILVIQMGETFHSLKKSVLRHRKRWEPQIYYNNQIMLARYNINFKKKKSHKLILHML